MAENTVLPKNTRGATPRETHLLSLKVGTFILIPTQPNFGNFLSPLQVWPVAEQEIFFSPMIIY